MVCPASALRGIIPIVDGEDESEFQCLMTQKGEKCVMSAMLPYSSMYNLVYSGRYCLRPLGLLLISSTSLATAVQSFPSSFGTTTRHRHLATPIPHTTHEMASPRAITALARSRPTYSLLSAAAGRPAAFSTGVVRQRAHEAKAEGLPPQGFRLPTPRKWNENKESIWDAAGKYFLLTEMARGMYVLLEQFFRPP